MAKRFTETTKWGDPWFSELEGSKKLLWLYLLDTCDHAGVYKHSPRLTQFHTEESHTVESICELFPNRCIMITEELIFIPKFLKFQYPSGIGSQKPAIVSVVKRLKELNLMDMVEELLSNDYVMIKEPLKNNSLTIKDKDKDKDKDMVKSKGKVKDKDKYSKEFESFWSLTKFPKRPQDTKADMSKKFEVLLKTFTFEDILLAGDTFAEANKGNEKFAMGMRKFLSCDETVKNHLEGNVADNRKLTLAERNNSVNSATFGINL